MLNSCSENNHNSNNFETISINLKEELTNVTLSSLINDDITFIPLETTRESIIGRINKVQFTENYIFILDVHSAQSIFKFKKSGEFLQKIGIKGAGPKELTRPLDFNISGNNLKVLDNGYSIITYDFDGNFIDRKPLKNTTALLFQNDNNTGDYIFFSGDNDYNLKIFDSLFNNKATLFPYKSRYEEQVIINPLFKNNNGSIIYRRFLNDTIFKVNQGQLLPYKLIDFNRNKLYIKDLAYSNENELIEKIQKHSIIRNYFENDNSTLLVFDLKNEVWVYFKQKVSKKSRLFKFKNLINDVTYEKNSTYVIGDYKDSFIFLVEAWSLLQINEKGSIENEKEIMKIIDQLEPEDNPVLMLARFN
jgi:hypothetical protein